MAGKGKCRQTWVILALKFEARHFAGLFYYLESPIINLLPKKSGLLLLSMKIMYRELLK